jgi:cellulose biosynthesis protein BcsQ
MSGAKAYVLAVASHKGGTGRTTTALALAWAWGRAGRDVGLVDADPSGAARLVAAGPGGRCDWTNVTLHESARQAARAGREVVVVDGPSLTDHDCWAVLGQADGVLLTCVADILTLRTLPLATEVLARGSQRATPPELHGVLLTRFRDDQYQPRLRAELERLEGDVLLGPDVPEDQALRTWALTPGADLPAGPGREAYRRLAEELGMRLGLGLTASGAA